MYVSGIVGREEHARFERIIIMSTRNGCRLLSGMYQRRTAVWEGRGATARPREVKWSSGDAVAFT